MALGLLPLTPCVDVSAAWLLSLFAAIGGVQQHACWGCACRWQPAMAAACSNWQPGQGVAVSCCCLVHLVAPSNAAAELLHVATATSNAPSFHSWFQQLAISLLLLVAFAPVLLLKAGHADAIQSIVGDRPAWVSIGFSVPTACFQAGRPEALGPKPEAWYERLSVSSWRVCRRVNMPERVLRSAMLLAPPATVGFCCYPCAWEERGAVALVLSGRPGCEPAIDLIAVHPQEGRTCPISLGT